MIVQALKEIQDRCGYLTHDEMQALSKRTGVPLHRIHEVATSIPCINCNLPRARVSRFAGTWPAIFMGLLK
ncbi:hypothetical protein EBX93_03920 [bacterium]|nr:hypothetical protein [bacterium]